MTRGGFQVPPQADVMDGFHLPPLIEEALDSSGESSTMLSIGGSHRKGRGLPHTSLSLMAFYLYTYLYKNKTAHVKFLGREMQFSIFNTGQQTVSVGTAESTLALPAWVVTW